MRTYSVCLLCASCFKRLQLQHHNRRFLSSWIHAFGPHGSPYIQLSQKYLGVLPAMQRRSYTQSAKTRDLDKGSLKIDDLPEEEETVTTRGKSAVKKADGWYITDPNLADKLAKLISAELCRSTFVIEVNPGPGILTKALVKHKVDNLILTETTEKFIPALQALATQSHRIRQVENFDFFRSSLSRLGNKAVKLIQDIPEKEWTDAPALAVISILSPKKDSSRKILRHLLHTAARRESLSTLGRIDSFLFISPVDRLIFLPLPFPIPIAKRNLYTRIHILYQLLFEMKTLAQVKKTEFSPPYPKSTKKSKHVDAADLHTLYLMHLRPRAEIFQMFTDPDDLTRFVGFIMHILRKKNARIIPKMECLVPGCGIHMISNGFTMMQTLWDISPQMYVKLYQDMLTWPEYAESSLRAEMLETTADIFEDDVPNIEEDIAEEGEEDESHDHHMTKRSNSESSSFT